MEVELQPAAAAATAASSAPAAELPGDSAMAGAAATDSGVAEAAAGSPMALVPPLDVAQAQRQVPIYMPLPEEIVEVTIYKQSRSQLLGIALYKPHVVGDATEAIVREVSEGSPVAGILNIGDKIVSIGGMLTNSPVLAAERLRESTGHIQVKKVPVKPDFAARALLAERKERNRMQGFSLPGVMSAPILSQGSGVLCATGEQRRVAMLGPNPQSPRNSAFRGGIEVVGGGHLPYIPGLDLKGIEEFLGGKKPANRPLSARVRSAIVNAPRNVAQSARSAASWARYPLTNFVNNNANIVSVG